jgi:hypothetical protein
MDKQESYLQRRSQLPSDEGVPIAAPRRLSAESIAATHPPAEGRSVNRGLQRPPRAKQYAPLDGTTHVPWCIRHRYEKEMLSCATVAWLLHLPACRHALFLGQTT